MKKLVLIVSVAAVLSACGSAVKLDNVPVEDKSGQAVSANGAAGNAGDGSGVAKSNVTSVALDKNAQDPALSAALKTVYFDYDSFVIRAEFQPTLEAHAKYLKADKSRKVNIEGHTDERGGREYNLALGQKRAEAVRKALKFKASLTPKWKPLATVRKNLLCWVILNLRWKKIVALSSATANHAFAFDDADRSKFVLGPVPLPRCRASVSGFV